MEENLEFDILNEEPIECILCSEVFEVHIDRQLILKHLLDIHKLVIEYPEQIADFRQYIQYWKKLECANLQEYCIVFSTNTTDTPRFRIPSVRHYYLLSDKLPEDKELRNSLKERKIIYLMQQKDKEIKDLEFSRRCIYCSLSIEGGVDNSFRHLIKDHGFHVGKPENIVFGAKLLDILCDMLKNLKCLYCEKTFKNHVILRQHMRKKQHRSLNPENKHYDKFYINNHLMPGVSWQEAKKEILSLREREMNDEQDVDEWIDEKEVDAAVCLFCPFVTKHVEFVLFDHMKSCHSFDFETLTKDMKYYSKIKLINFIRTQGMKRYCVGCDMRCTSSEAFEDHVKLCSCSSLPSVLTWDDPLYLFPVLENDIFLTHIEDTDIDEEDSSSLASSFGEEVVFVEDPHELFSGVNPWQLLAEDFEKESEERNRDRLFFGCFFCHFIAKGDEGKDVCIAHMESLHNFNYNEALGNLEEEDVKKAINYIRTMTSFGKCFVCEKSYNKQATLEGHRIAEEHNNLPPMDAFANERWKEIILPYDGFQILIKDR